MAEKTSSTTSSIDIKKAVSKILSTIEREREREIISRRFGLYDRKETLERIGEMLGITRERVRQLEKAVLIRLKVVSETDLPQMSEIDRFFIKHLHEMGGAARISDLTGRFLDKTNEQDRAHVAFLASLAPSLDIIDEDDRYYHGVVISELHDSVKARSYIDEIVTVVQKFNKPVSAEEIYAQTKHSHPDKVQALASLSKDLAYLNGKWGSIKWPTVNPRNIRDKIYVILSESTKPMHFNAIAVAIRDSAFKRRDVTTQAIHNELIKDTRFILIGRGIYALSEWGYKKGTVADVIETILKREKGPLHRDEIVKRVLKMRSVKETTILLNLQSKPQFKRVAKATYALGS